jgi:hypothetical protein
MEDEEEFENEDELEDTIELPSAWQPYQAEDGEPPKLCCRSVPLRFLQGLTLKKAEGKEGAMTMGMETMDGRLFKLYSTVYYGDGYTIADIDNPLEDLVGSPLVSVTEERSADDSSPFYVFRTVKASSTVRWSSPFGYDYGQEVELIEVKPAPTQAIDRPRTTPLKALTHGQTVWFFADWNGVVSDTLKIREDRGWITDGGVYYEDAVFHATQTEALSAFCTALEAKLAAAKEELDNIFDF